MTLPSTPPPPPPAIPEPTLRRFDMTANAVPHPSENGEWVMADDALRLLHAALRDAERLRTKVAAMEKAGDDADYFMGKLCKCDLYPERTQKCTACKIRANWTAAKAGAGN